MSPHSVAPTCVDNWPSPASLSTCAIRRNGTPSSMRSFRLTGGVPKPAFGGASAVLRYLGGYTHRVAISNHRLIAFDGERVTFQWKDYAQGHRWRTMTLTAMEFLRRFVQHVLPRGFVRIRQFRYLANTCRTAHLALARRLLQRVSPPSKTPSTAPAWHCPRCGAPMVLGPILSARHLATLTLGFNTS